MRVRQKMNLHFPIICTKEIETSRYNGQISQPEQPIYIKPFNVNLDEVSQPLRATLGYLCKRVLYQRKPKISRGWTGKRNIQNVLFFLCFSNIRNLEKTLSRTFLSLSFQASPFSNFGPSSIPLFSSNFVALKRLYVCSTNWVCKIDIKGAKLRKTIG